MTDDADDADLCIACKVKIAEIIFLPCCHVVYCASCNTRAPAKSACPLCRAPVDFTRPASRVICPDDPEKQSRLLINCLQTSAFRSLVAVFAAAVEDGGLGLLIWEASVACEELIKFLMLKRMAGDVSGTLLSPSDALDAAWHKALLCPRLYVQLCDTVSPGTLFDHVIPIQNEGRDERRARTMELYTHVFGVPDTMDVSMLWMDIVRSPVALANTILVIAVTLMGSRLCIRLDKTQTVMETLLKQVEVIKGIPVSQQRWIHNGHQLSPDRLVQTYDLETSDTIYLVVGPMRGC